jgi:O-antigen ligase
MPRLVRLAAFSSFLLHGVFILSARYRMSYDAYVHMFFADHYRNDWWSLWDERWYTGFTVTSYPPLVHQLIAALSHIIGLDAAFGLVLWVTVTLLPLAVYCFARIFLGKSSAGYAALGAAFLPSAYLTAHIFGQLPFLFGTVLALFGAASLVRFLREGGLHHLALTISIAAMTMAAHHAVLLLQPFLIFAVVTKLWFGHRDTKSPSIMFGSSSISTRLHLRLTIFLICAVIFSLIVIFPFWEWGRSQTIQTPIDHASRHNFFLNPMAPLLFFLPMYGPLVLLVPAALFMAGKRILGGLGISFFMLFLIGLGGTTPLPRLLFGRGWEWLTYDRFAFWASLLLLPFLGMVVILLRRRRSKGSGKKIFASLAVSSVIVGLVTTILPLQPGAVDMDKIVAFLGQDGHSGWRYITFGFGDQLALLSTVTTATTIDGSYHTARNLPELRTSGLAQIDTAFWFPNGLSALDPVLQKASERGVRWGFVNTPQYIPVLERNGWKKLTTFESGVQVWENPAASLPEISNPPPASPFKSFAWGTFPFLSLVTTLSLASLRFFPVQAEKILRGIYSFLIGLVPLALCFWYYTTIGQFPHPRVYFTYDHALLFMSDALVIFAVILWLSVRMARLAKTHSAPDRPPSKQYDLLLPLFAIFLLSSLSTLWSSDWRTSLYISIHIGLVCLLIFSLQDWIEAWKPFMLGLCAALAIQVITGFAGFAMQSTSFLDPLDMNWPGVLDPSIRGASVVQLQNGLRVLRAYGSLPHPNILGGFLLLCLLGPASLFIAARKTNIPSLILYVLGLTLILLTFSRSSWLGLIAFLIFLLLKIKFLDRSRLLLLFAASLITVVFTLYPIRDLVFTRISVAPVPTEQLSAFGRSWLNQQAVEMIMENPLTGVGAGSFILELADEAVEGAIIEPVHSLFLLVGAEFGILGLLLLVALFIMIASKMILLQRPQAILASATLAGLGVISLFDHYLWSLAPGRIMLGIALGLWAGQVFHDES